MKPIIKEYLIILGISLLSVVVILGIISLSTEKKLGYTNLQQNSSVVTTTFTGLTSSQVVYGAVSGNAGQTTNLTWDISNSRLGINTSTPGTSLYVVGDFTASTGTLANTFTKNITAVNGTVTTSLIVGSSAIGTNVGIQCLWNGTNYTLISFPANSTTPTYSTSTSC